jgi:hypothetical protein
MFLGLTLKNIIVMGLFTFLLILYLFPLDELLLRITSFRIKKSYIVGISLLLMFFSFYILKLAPIANVVNLLFIFWCFMLGFSVDRKYIYALALIFFALIPVSIVFKISSLAEYASTLCYFILLLGVFKDLFYEKIFKN